MSYITSKSKSHRLIHVELLRLLAMFLVIFNHTGERGFFLFADRMESPFYIPYMLASVFCKIAVPIFFMISGALLLGKEESLGQLFSKRIARMVIVLILISVPYYFWLHRSPETSVADFFSHIYGNSATTALWYLYSYIGLLLVMPFLRNMVKNMQERDFMYLLLGHIILVGVLPCLEFCLWEGNVTLRESFSAVLFTTQNVFYVLIGYYLERILDNKYYTARNVWLSILLSAVALIVTCLMIHYQVQITDVCNSAQSQTFFNCFICIPAMSVYFLMKYIAPKTKFQRLKTCVSILGGAVFGVYLIEKFMRTLTGYVYTLLVPIAGSFVASVIWSLAALCCGLVIIVSIKHIPVIKTVINRFI